MSSMRDMFVGIYFQDEASKVLDQIDKKMDEAERTVMGLGTKLGKTSSGFSSMGKVGVSSAASVSKGMNDGVQSVGKLNQKVGETGRGFASLKSTIIGVGTAVGAIKVIDKAMSMVKGAVDGAINRVDTLAGFPVVMEKMGFTSEQATGGINKLADGIQGLPTTLDGIVGSTQTISLMTGDLDKATDTALTLNNAFLASGSDAMDAERGLDQYVKMLSKGKVEADSWSTLQETMGFALNKTASAFGFTGKSAQQDLYKALQKGKITFDQFNNKLIDLNGGVGGFAEIAKDGSAGIGTSFSNMNTAVTRGVAGIIQSIQEVLKGTPLKSIENIFGLIGKGFSKTLGLVAEKIKGIDGKQLGDKLTQGFETVKSVAIPTLEGFKTGLSWIKDNKDTVIAATTGIAGGFAVFKTISTVKTALDLFKNSTILTTIATQGFNAALRANPIGLVATGIGLLISAGILLYQNWDIVRTKTGELWNKLGAFKGVATLVLGPIGQIIRTAVTMAEQWDSTKSVWENVWNGIKVSAANAVNDVIGSINWLIEKINAIPGVNVPIIPKVEWGNVNNGQGKKAINKVSAGGLVPEHATGLERVPYDGYFAKLHKDESVLTAQQSNALRNAGMLSQNSNGTPELNMGGDGSGGGANQQSPNAGGGGHQFIFHITGDSPQDIAQKVREVISDMLDSEMQTT
ncbi:tape measure protein [Lysinibacillus sp. NPDC092081]|uniref:tape measure protein n=1 Tax=Lysinibacillus sp. NPDC092081 TaxID=3364131 RepID=UPI00381CCC3E